MNADIALATSGIAGPGGGTSEKPVGTFWMACGFPGNIRSKKVQLSKHRTLNIRAGTDAALNMLRLFLLSLECAYLYITFLESNFRIPGLWPK